MYEKGQGLSQGYTKAIEYYKKAADQENERAKIYFQLAKQMN